MPHDNLNQPLKFLAHAAGVLGIPWWVDYLIAAARGSYPSNALIFGLSSVATATLFYVIARRIPHGFGLSAKEIAICFAAAGGLIASLWGFITQWDMGTIQAVRSAVRAVCLWAGIGFYNAGFWGAVRARRQFGNRLGWSK